MMMTMTMALSRLQAFRTGLLLLVFVQTVLLGAVIATEEACEAGVCEAAATTKTTLAQKCGKLVSGGDIYRHGGTAQAYKPNQPEKNTICEGYEGYSQRVASWPFSRSWRRSPPTVKLSVKLWTCEAASDGCCERLSKTKHSGTAVEVWQARPDGSYSSLRPGKQDGDCRAKQTFEKGAAVVTFETTVPGSTGCLGGIGPFRWDTWPYGPPALHMLVSGPGISSTLVDVPLLMDKTTLEQQSFGWYDWRGPAWVARKLKQEPYEISLWKAAQEANTVEIEMDLYLPATRSNEGTLKDGMCRSWIYGLPSSFFIEPIATCAPAMLDFFDL